MMNRGMKNELALLSGLGALLLRRRNPVLSFALGATSVGLLLSRKSIENFVGHSAVITGGSRGLGLALAHELAEQGAKITLLARDHEELIRAQTMILERTPGAEILVRACDVTNTVQLESALHQASHEMGGIDLLINNAGAITVGPYEKMNEDDFAAQLELHFYATMSAVNLSLPYLKDSVGRRIVNICSMGGRVAVPHMLPYDVSKFALAGYSQGITAELAPQGISVTTIYPALMRTGSPIQAVFKGDHEKEFAWFASADVIPGFSSDPAKIAKQILESARHRETELTPSLPGRARMMMASLFPELMTAIFKGVAGILPTGGSSEPRTGAQSRALFDRLPSTALLAESTREAELNYNQQPKTDARFNMGLPD